MTDYDRLFNVIRHLEGRAISAETMEECDCLCALADAIEQAYGIVDESRDDAYCRYVVMAG